MRPWRAGLHRRARTAARRLLLAAPMPRRIREALWHFGRRIPPPPGSLVARSDPDSGDAYAAWLAQHAFDPAAARERLESLRARPTFSIILPVHDPEPATSSERSRPWTGRCTRTGRLCIADDASTSAAVRAILADYVGREPRARHVRLEASQHIHGASNAAIELAGGELLAFLDHDDELAPDALLEVAALLQDDPGADLIYSDHDLLGEDGRRQSPRFAPGWSPELLLSYMYIRHLKVYRTELVRAVGGFRPGFEGSADYDLALRVAERTGRIRHIPRILYHWRAARDSIARTTPAKPYSVRGGPARPGGRWSAPRHRRHRRAARLRPAGAGGNLSPAVLPRHGTSR